MMPSRAEQSPPMTQGNVSDATARATAAERFCVMATSADSFMRVVAIPRSGVCAGRRRSSSLTTS